MIQEEHANNLIEIGASMAIFTLMGLFLEGGSLTAKEMQEISDIAAKDIEERTGMPAEDFALKVQPFVDITIKKAKER